MPLDVGLRVLRGRSVCWMRYVIDVAADRLTRIDPALPRGAPQRVGEPWVVNPSRGVCWRARRGTTPILLTVGRDTAVPHSHRLSLPRRSDPVSQN